MWGVIGILFIGATVSSFELPSLVKNKYRRELVVFFLFLIAGVTLNILLGFNVELPNPSYAILKFFTPLNDFVERVLS